MRDLVWITIPRLGLTMVIKFSKKYYNIKSEPLNAMTCEKTENQGNLLFYYVGLIIVVKRLVYNLNNL